MGQEKLSATNFGDIVCRNCGFVADPGIHHIELWPDDWKTKKCEKCGGGLKVCLRIPIALKSRSTFGWSRFSVRTHSDSEKK